MNWSYFLHWVLAAVLAYTFAVFLEWKKHDRLKRVIAVSVFLVSLSLGFLTRDTAAGIAKALANWLIPIAAISMAAIVRAMWKAVPVERVATELALAGLLIGFLNAFSFLLLTEVTGFVNVLITLVILVFCLEVENEPGGRLRRSLAMVFALMSVLVGSRMALYGPL